MTASEDKDLAAARYQGLELRTVWAREIWESQLKAKGVVRYQGIKGEAEAKT